MISNMIDKDYANSLEDGSVKLMNDLWINNKFSTFKVLRT